MAGGVDVGLARVLDDEGGAASLQPRLVFVLLTLISGFLGGDNTEPDAVVVCLGLDGRKMSELLQLTLQLGPVKVNKPFDFSGILSSTRCPIPVYIIQYP